MIYGDIYVIYMEKYVYMKYIHIYNIHIHIGGKRKRDLSCDV